MQFFQLSQVCTSRLHCPLVIAIYLGHLAVRVTFTVFSQRVSLMIKDYNKQPERPLWYEPHYRAAILPRVP